jgi:hypothetical protein
MSKRKRDRQDGHDIQVVTEESETDSSDNGQGQREQMVAEAAYYIAEHRDFQGGDPTADWLQAEREIDLRLGGR